VYEEGNKKEDIEFKDPISIFPLCNKQPPSSLPTSLYYVVSRGKHEWRSMVEYGLNKFFFVYNYYVRFFFNGAHNLVLTVVYASIYV